ncbi:MAG TPA: hypothetical protein VGO03_21320 [Acidimicrobiia bacterium]|jgi:hypothetical protein
MNVVIQCLLVSGALVATVGIVLLHHRTAGRRRRKTCEHMRRQALHVVRIAEAYATLARSVGVRPPETTPWQTLTDQGLWLTSETLELREQSRHPGLRKASAELCNSLVRLELAMHRRRRLRVPNAAHSEQQARVARQYRNSVDDFVFATRFLGIVVHADECVDAKRCTCGQSC